MLNMRFGEASVSFSEAAVLSAINEHGLMFVTSAGISGLSLSTVGAPGCVSSRLSMSVGTFKLGDENSTIQQDCSVANT